MARARVLIVDDDERNLIAMQSVVEEVADVVLARSGEEALRHLLKGEFAVILLDVFMPGIDGYETAQLIRQRDSSRRIPIIFLSAVNKEDQHLMRGYAMGAVDYVFKPVEPAILRSKVAVFVDLYEKTQEIQRKAAQEQKLLDDNLRIQGERLLAEQALRRAEERQALILRSLPIVLYLEPIDANPRIPQYVSGDLRTLTGFSLEDVKASPTLWADRLHPEDRERVLAARRSVASTGAMALEYRWMGADGSYKHLLEQAVVLRDLLGNPSEVAGTLLDVTDRKLLETQLIQSQKMDAVGKLTGGIAHDFNNLLAAVIGGLGLLERKSNLDEQGLKVVGMARHAAEQGTELVRRLLAFARRQRLDPAPVPMDHLAASMKGLMAHTLGGLVKVDWRIGADAWPALADENQLELALMNLIINARDAMPDGGTVTVSAENRSLSGLAQDGLAPGDYVVLSVADSGDGIAPELLDRIFEPFFTTKEVGKGTGLGLSMVYGFAQQSGGTVRVRSRQGEGTVFELWLPRSEAPAAGARAPASDEAAERAPTRSLRVLLVDDHHGVRATTCALVEELGHACVDAGSANEALAHVERGEAFDVIVTDYAMPDLSGTELIRRARKMTPGVSAIIVTGYADEDMISNRPDDVIVLIKPFQPGRLQAAFEQIAQLKGGAAQIQA